MISRETILKRLLRATANRVLQSAPPRTSGTVSGQSGIASSSPSGSVAIETAGHREIELPEQITYVAPENDEPERQRIFPSSRRSRGQRVMAAIWAARPWRPPTDEEIQYRAELDERKKREALLRDEAIRAKQLLIGALDRNGICYRYPRSSRDVFIGGIQSVHFDEIRLHDDALYYHVSTRHLPRGVNLTQMMDQGLLTDLSLSVGHRVTCEYSEVQGFWYIVERATGVRGVPAHVKFAEMLERFPGSADGLYLPIGMAANRKPIYLSAGSFYHAIIGGATGSGKSVLINSWIVTLIRRNLPGKLHMLMIDLKGGVEFQSYEGIPHLLTDIPNVPTGIVNRREDVVGALRHVYNIGEARLNTLRETGHRDIGRYNAHRRAAPMSHIFVIADELADLMMDREIKRDAEELIANMAARHRAAGIHLILCTQMPKVEVITGRIKANCPLRVALSCATNVASMVIIDNGNAHNLAPKGRAIAQFIQEIEVQTPLITDQIINDTVEGARAGQYQEIEAKHDVTRLELLNWALSNNDGRLTVRTLYQQFGTRGLTVEELSTWLEELEGETVIVGATEYLITPGRGSSPRKMVPVDSENPEIPQS